MATSAQIQRRFGFGELPDGVLFTSASEALDNEHVRGQVHYMRRAFDEMRLDGILCIDGKPTVYLKAFKRPLGRREVNALQKKFWNQGTGTLLLILDPSFIYVFSSMVLPSDDDAGDIDDHAGLVEKLELVDKALEARQFVMRVASGQYYREHADKFVQTGTVDRHLLDNLGHIGDKLRRDDSPDERRRVHAFLGRIIFACYLIDRGSIRLQDYSFVRKKNVTTLRELLEAYDAIEGKKLLYKLFDRLRDEFNGSMFETDLDAESRTVSKTDIENLCRFLRGEELNSQQTVLDFWAYDFSVIPVETISAIYEKFLEEEDATEKEQKGAFYTPRYLAEMVVDEAISDFDTLIDRRCLDPACGSGIFLVILFNRIAEELERKKPRAQQQTRLHELLDVLEHQICGVDVNLTACRIACFSLYVALLNQFDNASLKELRARNPKILPNLLVHKDDNFAKPDAPAIFEGNFFDPKLLPIHKTKFDIIVGNPPWVGRNQSSDKQVSDWVFGNDNPFLEGTPRAKQIAKFMPQTQIAHAFMWKVPLHLSDTGRVSLLLPVQVLLNQTDEFQHAWFSKFSAERIFNLSDYRRFLFQDADRPAMIFRFGLRGSTLASESIEYVVPKVRKQDPRSGVIHIFPEDRKWVPLGTILVASSQKNNGKPHDGVALVWKTLLWGTPRDVAFVDYLRTLDSLGDIAGKPSEGKRWTKGKGFKPWYQVSYDAAPVTYGEPKPIPGKLSDPCIETADDSLQMFVLRSDSNTLEEHLRSSHCKGRPGIPRERLRASLGGFHRSPDKKLFSPPLVLINKGFSKFAYVNFKVFYRDAMTGISGQQGDEELLQFFAAFAKSRLAKYFAFHTSGSWGTERDQVHVFELMRLPFPLPDSRHTHPDAESIVSEAASRIESLQNQVASEYEAAAKSDADYELRSQSLAESRRQRVEQLQDELEPLVYRYFKLTDKEITLVEDTCEICEESATPAKPDNRTEATRPSDKDDRKRYCSLLCKTLNTWSRADQPKGQKQPFYFAARNTPLNDVGMLLVTIYQADKAVAPSESSANGQLEDVVKRLQKSSGYQRGSFEYLRGVIFGDSNRKEIHILKPDMLGQWTRTAALNDADQIFQAIVGSKRN